MCVCLRERVRVCVNETQMCIYACGRVRLVVYLRDFLHVHVRELYPHIY